ncbi:glycoside hydrolase family 95 protein [Dysgonomonas sp. 216]|uniref:glycoside hydrolase family 95 protein n=1 Tax=Dysgonomonas sp. 216 TaxID=2302934 RepID=UPI0013D42D65|nr:glycoside hydrolase family 95 protein [Dysgonomonas sp. 216]NDW17619.1 glycoside hydrolase family 95 protein [Dysgonomonas sp. 216]
MKIKTFVLLLCFGLPLIAMSDNSNPLKLWYDKPATEWMQALPLGNGRLSMMVYGGIDSETIALNEITMWSGQHDKFQERPCGTEVLSDIRQLFFDGKYVEGNHIASEFLAGLPHSFGSHVPVGDLKIDFKYTDKEIKDYKRVLNLKNAVSEVSFKAGNVGYKREYFCSNPDDVVIIRLSSDKKGKLNFDLSFDLLRESQVLSQDNGIEFTGTVSFPKQGPGGVGFMGKVTVKVNNGKILANGGKITVKDATEAVIALDIRTDYKNPNYKSDCANSVSKSIQQNYNRLKDKHIKDYSALFSRVELSFGKSEADNLPTDVRWANVKSGKNDIGLDALFFHYARYLLIASSRENSPLPAALQGVWNDNLACNMGWTNDYHLDINTQQNYWLSNIGNLHECNAPLFEYIKDLAHHGEITAQKMYGTRGWTAHTVANVWGYTSSGSSVNWGLFPTGSSWIASHLWTHYSYTSDKDFLRKDAYPLLKGNAVFLLDYMVEHPKNGYLMTGPSTSPENSFVYDGQHISLSMMPTCDRQLAYEIFSSCVEASEILGIDAAFRDTLKNAIAKLPPIMIGKSGAIQEWFEDFEEAQPNHRHTSHLLALYPFAQITPEKTPELAKAAEKTIEYRLAADGWEDVEWSRANLICNYARLKDAQKAYSSVVDMQRFFARENLLTISPEGIAGAPYDIFVFDGNEAGGAGIVEMLIQSHLEYIEFLPALPKEWNTGYFKGLCVRGGADVDLKWKDGKVSEAKIVATSDNAFRIKLDTEQLIPQLKKNGRTIMLKQQANGLLSFELKKGETMELDYNV